MDKRVLGNNLRNIRNEKKLSQENLALKSNVSRNYISMIERGETENISNEIIKKLAWGLEVSFEQLIGKPNISSGTLIPPSLRSFAIKNNLKYEIVESLMEVPFRGKEPSTIKEWEELYNAIKDFISNDKS